MKTPLADEHQSNWTKTLASIFMVAVLVSCGKSGEQEAPQVPLPQPDWVSVQDGPRHPAELGLSPSTRSAHPLDPLPAGTQWRYWRYEVPGIKRLSLPRSRPMDIALVGIEGRVTALKANALCKTDDCDPIQPDFAAIAMLVGPPGSFEKFGVKLGSRIEYGQPSLPSPVRTYPLP